MEEKPEEIRNPGTDALIVAARSRRPQELIDALAKYDKLGKKFFESLPFTIVVRKDGSALFYYKKQTYKVDSPSDLKSFVKRFVKTKS